MTVANIEIIIDELVLTGFPRADRYRLAEAIRQQLTAQLTANPALGGTQSIDHLDAGEFPVPRGSKSADIGASAARSLHRSLIP